MLKNLEDDDLIFGTHDNPKYAETNEMQQLKRLLTKIGLYEKQENGHGKITSHSFRAYFITKVSRFDRDLAHFLAGQKNKMYLPRYDRLTDDEKLELYLKIEHDLLIDDSEKQQSKLNKVNKEKSDLEDVNQVLQQTIKEKDDITKQLREAKTIPINVDAINKRIDDIVKKQKEL